MKVREAIFVLLRNGGWRGPGSAGEEAEEPIISGGQLPEAESEFSGPYQKSFRGAVSAGKGSALLPDTGHAQEEGSSDI